MKPLIPLIILLLLTSPALAKHKKTEKQYQISWCEEFGGQAEVIISDRTRCDCLTDQYAIEHDFAAKWYEAIGQSLHYARLTGKRAGIALMLEKAKDPERWDNLNMVIQHFGLPITTWKIENIE